MRIDKLTTKFQQALADAQSLALGNDNGFIEPQHLLGALMGQQDGSTGSLLQRAGVNVPALRKALEDSIRRLPKVEGQGGEITISRPSAECQKISTSGSSSWKARLNHSVPQRMALLRVRSRARTRRPAGTSAAVRSPVPTSSRRARVTSAVTVSSRI